MSIFGKMFCTPGGGGGGGAVVPTVLVNTGSGELDSVGNGTAKETIIFFTAYPTLLGLSARADASRVTIYNTTVEDMTIKHNASATAADKFTLPMGRDYVLGANEAATFMYVTATSSWVMVSAQRERRVYDEQTVTTAGTVDNVPSGRREFNIVRLTAATQVNGFAAPQYAEYPKFLTVINQQPCTLKYASSGTVGNSMYMPGLADLVLNEYSVTHFVYTQGQWFQVGGIAAVPAP